LCALLLAGCGGNRDAQFAALADRFFDEVYFRYSPSSATSSGFHQHDTRLEDFARASIGEQVKTLRAFEQDVQQFDPARLSPPVADDREILLSSIRGALLSLETLRPWETQPDLYSSTATNAIFVTMSRTFAPPADRLASVIAREQQIPRLFEQARSNLRNPPRIATEIALEQLPGIESFFRNDVPAAFPGALTDEFRQANAAVLDALKSYGEFLRNDLLTRSTGDFRIGAENYRRKLLYDEMVDTPLEKLLETGYADLRRNQEEYRRVARRIDPGRSVDAVRADLERDHPAPDALLQSFRETLVGLRAFVEQHGVVTIPSPVPPIVRETPPFMRALTFASMDTPGPYETVAKEAFFNVTLPEATWPKNRIEDHMAAFNRGTVLATAIHEAYPGHYTQFLWVQRAPSKVRKLLGAASNAEGWAHYTEQMMLDEGFARHDRKMRLGQLQDALLRDARYIVGLRMHTQGMSFEGGVEFFVKEGFQPRANAERETKRGTSDPTYLVYTLGKLEILALREEVRKRKGAQFSLREFHDAFLAQGYPPIPIVRRALLGAGR
jgi:uncharacterized protein (DUF885 family)